MPNTTDINDVSKGCLSLRYLSLDDQSKFVTGSPEQIIAFVNNKEKCIEAKWISIIYTMFPHVREAFKRLYEPVPFNNVLLKYQFTPPTPIKGDAALLAKTILLIFPTYLFIFSCSRDNKPEKQILKWIKASQAGMPFPQITENDVRLALRALPLGRCEMSPIMLEALGYALCLDKAGKYNIRVKVTELMPATDLRSKYGMSNWTIRILNQLQLAYMNHGTYEIRMGMSMIPLMDQYMDKITDVWNSEMAKQKYSNTQNDVDEYGMNEAERSALDKIVNCLPRHDVATLVEMFKGLTLQKAVELAASLPSNLVNLVYERMEAGIGTGIFKLTQMGSWYPQMSNEKNMAIVKKAIRERYGKVRDTLHTHNTIHEKKLRDITDELLKVEKGNSLTSWYNHISELMRDICSNLDVRVEPSVYLDTIGLKLTLFNYFKQITDVIELGPDKFEPNLKRFEAPNMMGNTVLITPLPVCDMNVPRMY